MSSSHSSRFGYVMLLAVLGIVGGLVAVFLSNRVSNRDALDWEAQMR